MLHLSISSGSRLGPYEIIGSLGAGSDVMLTGALAGLASGSNLRLALISWNSVADGAAMTGSWSDQSRLWRRNVQRGRTIRKLSRATRRVVGRRSRLRQ